MITFSVPEYREECQQGLVGPGIEFEVAMAEESRFNPEVVTLLDTLTGPYIEPELENNGASKPEGAARQLLGWVYRACKDADWPVFQLGTFEPEVGLDLSGRYYLPTRRTTPFLPFRLFKVLLTALLKDAGDWDRVAFDDEFLRLNRLLKVNGLSGSNQRWALLGALKRGHTATETTNNIFQIGQGKSARLTRGTVVERNSQLLTEIQTDKMATARLLRLHGIPTVEHRRVYSDAHAVAAAEAIGYPVVLKPFNGTQGEGVQADIRDQPQLLRALAAKTFDTKRGIIERYVPGDIARIGVSNGKIIEVRVNRMAVVVGDGRSTFMTLLQHLAERELDEPGKEIKQVVDLDKLIERVKLAEIREKNAVDFDSIIENGRKIRVLDFPSRWLGAPVHWDKTEDLSEVYREIIRKLQRLFGEGPLGIDVLNYSNIRPEDSVINEVNFGPGMPFTQAHKPLLDSLNL